MNQTLAQEFEDRVGNNILPLVGVLANFKNPQKRAEMGELFVSEIRGYQGRHPGTIDEALSELERQASQTDWNDQTSLRRLKRAYDSVYTQLNRK